jgi:glycosyltransferase involved in cell wall biosynthesis
MRVGLVVPGFSADADDWCIPALRHLARGLAASGDDLRVVAVRYPYRAGRYVIDGVEVMAVGGAVRRRRGTLTVWQRTLQAIGAEHRRRKFDVLHAFWATESGLLTAIAGRVLRIPTLVSLAGGELVGLPEIGYGDQLFAWERLKVRASLRLASAVSAGSHYLLKLAERHVARHRLHRAPLGVDLELFTPGTLETAGGRLVQVGTLTGVKDQATLLHAFRLVRQQSDSATLDIVGDGPLRAGLERLAAELGIARSVSLRGNLDHAALPSVYHTGDAFVVSSRHEAQSMVAAEAAACGMPIVGTNVGIIPELAAPKRVVPVGAADALAAAMLAALDHPRTAPTAESVQATFGLEPCTARFRALYTRLTAR